MKSKREKKVWTPPTTTKIFSSRASTRPRDVFMIQAVAGDPRTAVGFCTRGQILSTWRKLLRMRPSVYSPPRWKPELM